VECRETLRNAVDNHNFLWTTGLNILRAQPDVRMMHKRRCRAGGEQREARRWGLHYGRRQLNECEIADTTFDALLAERSANGRAARSILAQIEPRGVRLGASSRVR